MSILVSVVILTYKHEEFIKQTVKSTLQQITDFDVEIIIADDSSPDNTEFVINSIIEENKGHNTIKYFRHKTNIGAHFNGPFAINKCSGKYIAFCEGDDYWTDPYKLQKQVDFLEANPEYVACFHDVEAIGKDGQIVHEHTLKVPENYETIYDIAQNGNFIHTPSIVFRNVLGSLPEHFFLSPIGDFYIYMLLAAKGKFYYMRESMAVYRCDVGSFSTLDAKIKSLKFNQCIFLIWLHFKNKNKQLSAILFNRLWAYIKNAESSTAISDILDPYPVNKEEILTEWLFQLEEVYRGKLKEEANNSVNVYLREAGIVFLSKVIFYKIRTRIVIWIKK
jgi:glycosyltransferase involved in cell wall biosynthesis